MKFFCAVVILFGAVMETHQSKEMEIVQKLVKNSDKTLPRKDKSTDVQIGMYLNDIYLDRERGMMNFHGYLRHFWQDPRLNFTRQGKNLGKIIVPDDYLESFWRPDIFIRNAKDVKVYYKPVPNFLMTIDFTGNVWYVYKASIEVACQDLKKGGNAICGIMFESFKYTTDQMSISFIPSPVDVDPDIYIQDYHLEDYTFEDCTQNYTAGSFPCLHTKFILKQDCFFCFN